MIHRYIDPVDIIKETDTTIIIQLNRNTRYHKSKFLYYKQLYLDHIKLNYTYPTYTIDDVMDMKPDNYIEQVMLVVLNTSSENYTVTNFYVLKIDYIDDHELPF